jgi:small subunit ribosomal protein S8
MSMTDPIADLLTRIRNGLQARHPTVDVPASRLKLAIVKILTDEGYVDGFETFEEGPRNVIRIRLKYSPSGGRVVTGLERVSRPGLRVYCGRDEIPKVLGGLGINILSTPKGILTGSASRKAGVGGEILCNIW